MKSLILAAISALVLLQEGQGQNYNLNPFAGYRPLRPLINRPHFQNGFGGMSNFNQNYHYGSHATNIGRRKRSPQFHQNYHPGSQSQNFNCRFGGCGNIPGMQQIHGGNVHNSGGNFNQNYFGGSQATNWGRKKREVGDHDDNDEEVEEEAKITARTKTNPTELLESLPELTDTKNCFCKVNDVEDARQFFTYPSRPSKVRGTVLCTYPNGLPACKCMCDPFTIINPNPTYTSTSWPSYPQTYPQRYPGFHQTYVYGRKKRETTEPIKTELIEEVIEVSDNPAAMKCLCSSDQGIKMPGTVLCTYPGGKVSCKCTCKPFTIIEVDYTRLYPVVRKKRSANPQFIQNYQPGSQSQNFNCHFGGCGNIPGMQQIHGGQVFNHGSNFNQNYHHGSHATNIGRKKRSPQFFQSFSPGYANVNNMMTNLNPFSQRPQQVPQQLANMMTNLNPFGQRTEQVEQVVKRSANPQFHQNYHPGSQSQNFNCRYGGCGNIPGMQQIHGGHVSNHGSNFNQNYFGGSYATNIGRKKRSPQFYQSFAPGSANVNCDSKGCGPAHMYPGTTSMATQFGNMMTNWNPFAQKPQQAPQQVQQYAQQVQQYPQQVQPGFMHFGQLPQKPAATIME